MMDRIYGDGSGGGYMNNGGNNNGTGNGGGDRSNLGPTYGTQNQGTNQNDWGNYVNSMMPGYMQNQSQNQSQYPGPQNRYIPNVPLMQQNQNYQLDPIYNGIFNPY